MNFTSENIKKILEEFSLDTETGLSKEEVIKNREKYGKNTLPKHKKKSILQLFWSQLNDWLIYILFSAVLITGFMGEYVDATIILCVIFVNSILGVVQEYRAGKAIDALRKLSSPHTLVRRGGVAMEIDASEVVVGDIVVLDAGRIIPADMRLIESADLSIEESALTGESLPVHKDADFQSTEDMGVGDRKNIAYMSTIITAGRGIAVVVATGKNTEIGKIAKLLDDEEKEKTPLEIKLNLLGKTLGKIAIAICVLMFAIGIFQGREVTEMFLISVSLAVASIPEGLAAIVAVVLSIGVSQMSKKNAIIKKLPAVETLGSVDTICSDKTGTLTQNKMTVVEMWSGNISQKISPESQYSDQEKFLSKAMVLSSDATYKDGEATGDPTEVALLYLADELGIDRESLEKTCTREDEIPFDSDRKLMSTLIKEDGKYKIYTKGAIDQLLGICTHIQIGDEIKALDEKIKEEISHTMQQMSDKALRTLGIAYKSIDTKIESKEFEKGLTFVGLVGMIDPPREEVKVSIRTAREAGITPIMITGDYKNTAFAIAKELGITDDINSVITGEEIDVMSESEFAKNIESYHIFARVSPEHKIRIVKALKKAGHVVSMTGDGVNDAPSLRGADIGVAMGITGTDVAKWASDMILTDDNFSTIIVAVEAGRNIFNNIKKTIIFLLACNFGEVVAMFVIIFLGWETPLLAIQLLWINLLTDSLPAIALGMDTGSSEVMKKKPRPAKESFFADWAGVQILVYGLLMGVMTIAAFWYGYHIAGYSPFADNIPEDITTQARTFAFMTLVLTQMFFTFSIRSKTLSFIESGIFKNKFLVISVLVAVALQIILIYTPALHDIFHLSYLSSENWIYIIGLAIIPSAIHEIIKKFKKV